MVNATGFILMAYTLSLHQAQGQHKQANINYKRGKKAPLKSIKMKDETITGSTDAGAGKESELREALQQATDFIQQWAQKPNEFELLKRCKSLLTAPSTHSSSEMVEQWISVKDRLPDTSGQVYGCMHKTQDIYICHFKKARNLFQVYGAGADPISDMKVTHWKPLNKPPMDVCREIDCNKPATKEEYPGNAFYLCDEHFDKYKNLL